MKYLYFGLFLSLALFLGFMKAPPFSKKLLVPCGEEKLVALNFPELNALVSKPLRYLGHGAEAIAFATADNNYVIKFFLTQRIFTKPNLNPFQKVRKLISIPYPPRKKEILLSRYEQGFHTLPELTAMLAVHRYTSPEILPECTLIDYHGVKHSLDLNKVAFVVQRKGTPLKKGTLANNRNLFDPKLHDLFTALTNKGFVNLSKGFTPKNFAILDDKAIMIDLGKLEYFPERAHTTEQENFQRRYLKALK